MLESEFEELSLHIDRLSEALRRRLEVTESILDDPKYNQKTSFSFQNNKQTNPTRYNKHTNNHHKASNNNPYHNNSNPYHSNSNPTDNSKHPMYNHKNIHKHDVDATNENNYKIREATYNHQNTSFNINYNFNRSPETYFEKSIIN
ncbi:GATA zinc finger domain-containing protein 14 isoform X2 [Eurytemora carolleeae]|uniref:GATA zinc finger domain-containing protein 14 isoform X1 n=1 Tax=Eurytemora carolleeae TaxID=1294199 RepID=UPI000C77DDF5|nr:GATA zinc finger domain-containing protein 14 isoform X1 [Eurytemora carolleeae]XP_023339451.1 GATA zinc finger domain-containing protein 14 isoform X2 [Eurytemora carolleeae]|eukprot:XP_023339449.1 GATA zinc finger domain-containing protein 14-like isoform X1 [Eurytemora affinis]